MGDFEDFDGLVAPGERDDEIPCCGEYRKVPLHAGQSAERLKVVRRDVDRAFRLTDVGDLFDFACDVMRAPEARIFAKLKLQATWNDAVEKRHERPSFDRARLEVMTNALDSRIWRSPTHYGTDLDPRDGVPRERSLGDDE